MVTTTTCFIDYTATGGNTRFQFPFFSLSESYVFAEIDGVAVGATVRLNAEKIGGEANLHVRPRSGSRVRIFRKTPRLQTLQLNYNSEFDSESIEAAFDRSICIEQETAAALEEMRARMDALLSLKQGPKGDKGDPGMPAGTNWTTVFYKSDTKPAAPTETTIDPDNPVPAGWSDGWTDSDPNWWQSRAKYDQSGNVIVPWSEPSPVTAKQGPWPSMVFLLAAANVAPPAPTAPSGPIPTGWADGPSSVPPEGQCWWMSKGDVVQGVVSVWSTPIPAQGRTGAPGEDGWMIEPWYKLFPAGTTNVTPPFSYPPTAQGWTLNLQVPAQGQELWQANITLDGDDEPQGAWSVTRVTGEKGTPGDYQTFVFQTAEEKPETPDTTDPLPEGWKDTWDAADVATGEPIWMTQAWVSGATDTVIPDPATGILWTMPVPINRVVDNVYFIFFKAKTAPQALSPGIYPDSPEFEASGWSYKIEDLGALEPFDRIWASKGVYDIANKSITQAWTVPEPWSGESGEDGQVPVILYKNWEPPAGSNPDAKPDKPSGPPLPSPPNPLPDGWTQWSANYTAWASNEGGGWLKGVNQTDNFSKVWQTNAILNAGGTAFISAWTDSIQVTGERGTSGADGKNGLKGDDGDRGPAPVMDIGTVTTSPSAWATVSPDPQMVGKYLINLGLPASKEQGPKGDQGIPGSGAYTSARGDFPIPAFWASNETCDPQTSVCWWSLNGGVMNISVAWEAGPMTRNSKNVTSFASGDLIIDVSEIPPLFWPPIPAAVQETGGAIPCSSAGRRFNDNDNDEPTCRFGIFDGKLCFIPGSDTNISAWATFNKNRIIYNKSNRNATTYFLMSVSYNIYVPAPTKQPPLISEPPNDVTVLCTEGSSVTLTIFAVGDEPITYTWFKGDTKIDGVTGSQYRIGATTRNDSGLYYANAKNDVGDNDSPILTLDVQYPPAITTQPQSQSVAAGASVTFSVVADGNPAPTYQWFRQIGSAARIPTSGETSATTTVQNVDGNFNGVAISCDVTNSIGTVTSSAATLTVT